MNGSLHLYSISNINIFFLAKANGITPYMWFVFRETGVGHIALHVNVFLLALHWALRHNLRDWRPFCCGFCLFSSWANGFSLGTMVSSNCPKTCQLVFTVIRGVSSAIAVSVNICVYTSPLCWLWILLSSSKSKMCHAAVKCFLFIRESTLFMRGLHLQMTAAAVKWRNLLGFCFWTSVSRILSSSPD